MPLTVDLVIPGKIVSREIVIGVFGVVNRICAAINLVSPVPPGVAQANVAGELGIRRPWRGVASGRQSGLRCV